MNKNLPAKRKRRRRVDVDTPVEAEDATPTSTLEGVTPKLPEDILVHSSCSNTLIKGLIQNSIDGILLQSGLDVIRVSSTVFLHRFLMDLSRIPAVIAAIESSATMDQDRVLLTAMREVAATKQEYQFLESALDASWEARFDASHKKRKSILLSDIPSTKASVKTARSTSRKKLSSSSLVSGAVASLPTASIVPSFEEVCPSITRRQPQEVVWDQEDYD